GVSSACTPPSTIPSICNATSSPDPHCGSSDPKRTVARCCRSGMTLGKFGSQCVLVRVAVTKPRRLWIGDFNEAGVAAQTSIFVPRHQLAAELKEVIEGAYRKRGEPINVPILR